MSSRLTIARKSIEAAIAEEEYRIAVLRSAIDTLKAKHA